jgi:competence protein ComEC
VLGSELADTAPVAAATRVSWRDAVALTTAELRVNTARAFLWTPVAFGLGASGYLEAGREPSFWLLGGVTLVLTAAWWALRQRNAAALLVALASLAACGAAGGLAAKVRSDRVAAPDPGDDR